MSALIEKTLAEIARKRIEPVPAWRSRTTNAFYWIGTLLLLILGALAIELSLHAIFEIDWEAYSKADFSLIQTVLSGVPLLSLVLLGVFLWVGTFLIRQTRRGYRYPISTLLGIFFVFNVAIGFLIEESPLDEPSERFLLGLIPHDEETNTSLLPSASRQWSQPERGLLGGTILSSDSTTLLLRDSTERLWTVDYRDADVQTGVIVQPNQEVKVIGEKEDEKKFRAAEVRAWKKTSNRDAEEEEKERSEESDLNDNDEENEDDESED